MPFIGGAPEWDENLAKQGIVVGSAAIYRCSDDSSRPTPYINSDGSVDGLANRASYLMNSLLSHKTRRYGRLELIEFDHVGTSQFISFSERNAVAFDPATGNDPRQDDYDVWLGTGIIQPWIDYARHAGGANYLYLDGHVATLNWATAVRDMYPDKVVLTKDGSYPN